MNDSRNYLLENLSNGNFSQEYKDLILEYTAKLSEKNLPVIYSTKHLSLLLGFDYFELKEIIRQREIRYRFYQISKKNGGKRGISVPLKDLKYIQDWIKINILDKVSPEESAQAYIKGKSILTNASIHKNAESILNIDLQKFFDSITEYKVYHLFKSLGYHTNLSVDFAKLCTCPISEDYFSTFSEVEVNFFSELYSWRIGVLPQGASTSPGISNLICKRLDRRLKGYAVKNNINYSRYSDDLSFSGNKKNLPKLDLLYKITSEEGFKINDKKIKFYIRGQRQMVTGLLINETIRVPKKFKKEIFRHLYFCIKFSPRVHFENIAKLRGEEVKGFQKEWMLGKIRYVYSIEPDEGKKMFKLFSQVKWGI